MKTILFAFDSFKESMSAETACQMAKEGFSAVFGDRYLYRCFPMADGGEGTLDILLQCGEGTLKRVLVTGPYGKPVEAKIGLRHDKTAIIESAQACGLMLTSIDERHPLTATTFGLGEMINAVLDEGCKKILFTLGGSATCDGGFGMLLALGAIPVWEEGFLQPQERSKQGIPQLLTHLKSLDLTPVYERLRGCELIIASDVTNPLLGENGAAAVFAPQKGATVEEVAVLEEALAHLSRLVSPQSADQAGAGAAGGLGWALLTLGASMESGISLVMRETGFLDALSQAEMIFTGEGAIDGQTVQGKVVSGILQAAAPYHVPVIAFAGAIKGDLALLYQMGLTAAFSINDRIMPIEQALKEGPEAMKRTAEKVARLLASSKN